MLAHIILLIFLSILTNSKQDCVVNSITKEDAWDKVLHRDLMKQYKFKQSPGNQSCVTVKVSLGLRSFALDDYEGKFTARFWARLVWIDERLTWSPENYGGVSQIIVRISNIWVPSLKLLNSAEPALYLAKFRECMVFDKGEILWVPEIVYKSYCSAKLSNWPYDVQNCTLQFGNGDRLNVARFRFADDAVTFSPTEYASGWNISLADTKENLNPDVHLSVSLSMERQKYGLAVILVGPCLVISILTVTSVLLNVKDYTRFGFSCFSLISHFVFLFAIDEFLPKHSADTPVILFFVSSSMILTITSVLVSFILFNIVKRKSVPFEWISSVTNKVFDSFAQYLVFPRWYVLDSEHVYVKNNETWTRFASILNSLYLVLVIIVYISLFIAYMPKQPKTGN